MSGDINKNFLLSSNKEHLHDFVNVKIKSIPGKTVTDSELTQAVKRIYENEYKKGNIIKNLEISPTDLSQYVVTKSVSSADIKSLSDLQIKILQASEKALPV